MTAYVDEVVGNDSTADGTEALPYLTPLAALIAHGMETNLLVKKASTPATADTPEVPSAYAPISGAASKKAKKALDTLQNKAAKAGSVKVLTEEEKLEIVRIKEAAEAKKLEESKALVLVEDESLPVARRVSAGCLASPNRHSDY